MAKVKKVKLPTRAQYVGAKMANFLYNLKSNQALSKEDRERAALLQNQWDTLATFRLDNPIVGAELEKALQAGELK